MTDTIKFSELQELGTIKPGTIIPVVDNGLNKIITGATILEYIGDAPGNAGPTGPRGPAGATGPEGPTGPRGFTGSRGDAGIQGVQGPSGGLGFTGSRGTEALWNFREAYNVGSMYEEGDVVTFQGQLWYRILGDNSVVGYPPGIGNTYWRLLAAKGDIGPSGLAGPSGASGALGYTGSRGVGFTGSRGDQGFPGSQGPIGPLGPTGVTGATGATGTVGATGATGTPGFTGSQGPQGIQGITGFVGSKGDVGATGSQGYTGSTGIDIPDSDGFLYNDSNGNFNWIGISFDGGGAGGNGSNVLVGGGNATVVPSLITTGGVAESDLALSFAPVAFTGSYDDLIGNTDRLVNGSYQLILGPDGLTTVPGNISQQGAPGLTIGSSHSVYIVGDQGDNNRTWAFDGVGGDLVLPRGSIIGETINTTVITPPTASPGQSLVIRPTASLWSVTSSGNIVYGSPITISVNLLTWPYFGTIIYDFSGPGVTEESLGRPLVGQIVFTGIQQSDTKTVTWTIPANSNITEFTFTLLDVQGVRSTDYLTETDPALYYNFEYNAMPTGQFITVTNSGMVNSEASHVHLIAGDPTTTDIYLGDDDQYVKIEKNGGNVIIGTDTNTKQWTFGTDGNLTLPQTNMSSSPAPVSLPGITYTDGTFQSGRTIVVPQDQSMKLEFTSLMHGSSNLEIRSNGIKTSTQSIILEDGDSHYFSFETSDKQITFSDSYGFILFGTKTRNQTGHFNDIEIKSYGDGTNGNVYISAGGNPTDNRWTFQQNGTLVVPGAVQNTTYFEIKAGTVSNNTWNFGIDGSTVFPNNTLKGYCFTTTNSVTNYLPQAAQFLYSDSPILSQISSIGGTWYIKGPGLVGWKQITSVQDNSGVALIVRIGSGNTPLPDGSEFPAGGGNVYTISQYLELDIKVADRTWEFRENGNLTLPQTNMNTSPAPTSLPGITFTDGTFQTTAFTTAYVNLLQSNITAISSSLANYATITYVDNSLANLVASAPTTLNTLNELALALNSDVNFSTTVTTLIGTKANTASLSTVAFTGNYADLLNKPTLVSSLSIVGANLQVVKTDSTTTDLGSVLGYAGSQGIQGITGFVGSQGIQGITGFVGSQGIQGIQGITGFVGSQGIQGIQGITGFVGSQGIQGIQGITGFVGSQGIQGITGFVGSQGTQGIQGITGFVGSEGIQGVNGYTGSQGAIGATGPVGATGPQGIQGIQGIQGYTGSEGATGATGLIGFSGSQGIQGIQGITGFVGSQGIQGITGFVGSQGDTGSTGLTGATGPIGATGPQGIQGYAGSRGVDGYAGSKGDTGATGATGPQGTNITFKGSVSTPGNLGSIASPTIGDAYIVDSDGNLYVWNGATWTDAGQIVGPTGPQGYAGSIGAVGATGATGAIGFAGSQGIQGATGFVGSQGVQGATGFVGSQGAIGATGPQGIQGIQGDTGFVGSQGAVGATGPTGATGLTGATGPIGATGPQGIQGIQGVVGFTGSQGVVGFVGSIGSTGPTGATGPSGPVGTADTVYNAGNVTGTVTFDYANGGVQKATLTGSITINSIATLTTGQGITLILTQDGTGGRTLTVGASLKFASNFKTLSTVAGAIDIVNIFYDGTNYYCTLTTGYA